MEVTKDTPIYVVNGVRVYPDGTPAPEEVVEEKPAPKQATK